MKTISEISKWITQEQGYKQFKQSFEYPYSFKTLFQKTVKSESVCDMNGALFINIHICQMKTELDIYENCRVEIAGEKNNKWWTLDCSIYVVDRLLNELSQIENKLVTLFNII